MTKYIIILLLGVIYSCESSFPIEKTLPKEDVLIKDGYANHQDSVYFEYFKELLQTFSVEQDEKFSIKGKNGTIIKFPESCFGDYHGKVIVKLVEVYDIVSMIKLNLSTITSNDRILETGGMIYVEPSDTNGNLLTPQKKYSIEFWKNKDGEMKLFNAERKNIREQTKWNLINNSRKETKPIIKRV